MMMTTMATIVEIVIIDIMNALRSNFGISEVGLVELETCVGIRIGRLGWEDDVGL